MLHICCYVRSIYNSPVLFLIDTGWGAVTEQISVQWDKIKSVKERFNPMVIHRLVEVDCVPIKVEGFVSALITMGEVTLQHDLQ